MGSSGSASWTLAAELDRDASPSKITGQPQQTRLLGDEVDRGTGLGSARRETGSTDPVRSKIKPDPTVARANKRLASRFYQLKTGHCLTPVDDKSPGRQVLVVPAPALGPNSRAPVRKLPAVESQQKPLWGHRPGGDREALPGVGIVPRSRSCSRSRDSGCRKDGRPTGGRRRKEAVGEQEREEHLAGGGMVYQISIRLGRSLAATRRG